MQEARGAPTKSPLTHPMVRLSELTPRINFGPIERIAVCDGDPVFDPPAHLALKTEFGAESGADRMRIDENALRQIRRKAGQLVKHPGFTGTDRDDIEQELALELLRRQDEYDPDQAPRGVFTAGVLRQRAARMRRARSARKRGGAETICSLSDKVRDEESECVELADTLSEEDRLRRTGGQARSAVELCDLRLDVRAVLVRLPGRLRKLANLLKTQSVGEISRASGIPRRTLHRDIERLRAAFERAGLGRKFLAQFETRLRN